MLRIVMPTIETVSQDMIEQFYSLVQSHATQLGFHHKAQLRQQLEANKSKASVFWALNEAGHIIGYTACGSRQHYAHLMRMGDIAVPEHLRRARIGTALYAAVFATAILEGRRQLEDTIIYSLSPFMADGFLPSLGFEPAGILKKRTGGFRDIHLLTADISSDWIEAVFNRLAPDTVIELVDQETARSAFVTQMKDYEKYDKKLVEDMKLCRQFVMSHCKVTHDGKGESKTQKGFFG